MAVAKVPISHGEIAGSATAKQLPTLACPGTVLLKAQVDNAGDVFVGLSNAVTVAAGSQDVTTGFQLDAGEELELSIENLNEIWIICDGASDDLTYMIFGG